MNKVLASVAVVTVACLPLTACGSKADPAVTHAKDSIKTFLVDKASASSSNFKPMKDPKVSECFAGTLVDKLGVAKLKTYGMLDADGNAKEGMFQTTPATKDDSAIFVDAMFACIGDTALLDAIKTDMSTRLATKPAAAKDCAMKLYTKDFVRGLLIAQYEGANSEDAKAVVTEDLKKLKACGV